VHLELGELAHSQVDVETFARLDFGAVGAFVVDTNAHVEGQRVDELEWRVEHDFVVGVH